MTEEKKEPLLRIELDEITSVPKVFYKGEEVTKKVKVQFHWETAGDTIKIMSPIIHIESLKEGQLPWDNNKVIHHVGFPTKEYEVKEEDDSEEFDW
jgi:hypothetical protein